MNNNNKVISNNFRGKNDLLKTNKNEINNNINKDKDTTNIINDEHNNNSESLIDIVFKFSNILEKDHLSIKYIKIIIMTYFLPFSEFIYKKRKKGRINITKIVGNNQVMYYYINRIELADISSFINIKYKNYKPDTKKYIYLK